MHNKKIEAPKTPPTALPKNPVPLSSISLPRAASTSPSPTFPLPPQPSSLHPHSSPSHSSPASASELRAEQQTSGARREGAAPARRRTTRRRRSAKKRLPLGFGSTCRADDEEDATAGSGARGAVETDAMDEREARRSRAAVGIVLDGSTPDPRSPTVAPAPRLDAVPVGRASRWTSPRRLLTAAAPHSGPPGRASPRPAPTGPPLRRRQIFAFLFLDDAHLQFGKPRTQNR